ncbi:MAG: cytochrome c maturation protein CcmE [Anaerolineae bacterium]|nr:cytochrome c maturation protein CcmE [Anaerolineae bacterium]
MTNITWEKTAETARVHRGQVAIQRRFGYLIIGVALIAVVAYLLISGMATGRYYMTVEELVEGDNVGKSVRVAGAVDGNTIRFDPITQELSFVVANIPNDDKALKEAGGLSYVLYEAANNPDSIRIQVVWQNAEMPDLLQHEAQAIMTGELDENGVFHANEVLLKCPTRYSDDVPTQAQVGG